MSTRSKILVLCILATWTWGVGSVESNEKKTLTSPAPEFQMVEKEEIDVQMPSTTKSDISDVPNDLDTSDMDPAGSVKPKETGSSGKIKPRKGVTADGFNVSDTTYEVKEPQEETHETASVTGNSSSSVSKEPSSVEKTNGSGASIGTGSVTPLGVPSAKKPSLTFSPEDNPDILNAASNPKKLPESSPSTGIVSPSVQDHMQTVEEPNLGYSKEPESDDEDVNFGGFLSYIVISVMVLLFIAVPIVFGRKFKDYWATRHYRRVDFLVDGMYNE